LLTTAKDIQNLPPDAPSLSAPIPIWWLEIAVEVDRPRELVALVRKRIAGGAPL
jgi:hypothetical protein